MSREAESLWTDVEEALKWKPILPLLRAAREAQDIVSKMEAIERVAAFVIRTMFQADPYQHRAFMLYCLVSDLVRKDPRVRAVVEDFVK